MTTQSVSPGWLDIASVVADLWPRSAWRPGTINAGWAICKSVPNAALMASVESLARDGREAAPSPSVVCHRALEIIEADQAKRAVLPAPERQGDILTPDQHHAAVAEISRGMTAEHHRRVAAVMRLLREKGVRIPLAELARLMPEKHYTAAAFDRRMKELEPADQLALESRS